MLALFDPDNPWLAVLGRTHPLVLHLPIGLFVGIALLEFGAWMFKKPVPRGAIAVLAAFAAVMAVITAASGWVLADAHSPSGQPEYGGSLLDRHRALGVATAAAGVLTALVSGLRARAACRWLLAVTLGLMTAAGHLGASITHGENFLSEPLFEKAPTPPRPQPAPAALPTAPNAATTQDPPALPPVGAQPQAPSDAPKPDGSAPSYAAVIAPFLERTCMKCHSDTKHKGDLRLGSKEGILAGGEKEVAVVPGKPAESRMYVRLTLPLDDEDHMPPKDKPQPSAEEIETLRQWIAAGAPFDGDAPAAGNRAAPAPDPAAGPKQEPTPAPADPGKKETAAAIQTLRSALAHVAPIAAGSELLRVDFAAIAPQVDDREAAALLAPLCDHIAELSMARTAITDAALAKFAAMPNLRDLDLRGTAVTSTGVASLRSAPKLERLVLVQTHLDDSATVSLCAMPSLHEVYLWQSGVSEAAVAKLRLDAPALQVDAGEPAAAAALEVEPEVALGKVTAPPAAAPAGAPAPAAATASLSPINSICPVSGKPVDAHFLVLYDGKVVGFCCPNCPKTFWQDPAKYPVAAK